MRRDVFAQLASVLSSLPSSAWPHYGLLATRYRVSVEAVASIYMQAARLQVMRTVKAFEADISIYAARYQSGEEVLELCDTADMPPCMFLRRLLEHTPWSCSKQAIKRILKDPEMAKTLLSMPADGASISRIVADIKVCLECDQVYSPSADAKCHDIGVQYERKLESCLSQAKLAYNTEASLRTAGAFKTPDAHLQVPFAVKGKVVNWIDSKATFGDDHIHREQTRDQYSKYINRYGPGMVIYWFGFIDDLQGKTADLVLADAFPAPEDVTQLLCLHVPSDLLPSSSESRSIEQSAVCDVVDSELPSL